MNVLTADRLSRMAAAYADDKRFGANHRAELRRAKSPDELLLSPVFYRLAEIAGLDGSDNVALEALTRVVWILPAMSHRSGAHPTGRVLRTTLFGDLKDSDLAKGATRLRQLLAVRNGDLTNFTLRLRKLLSHAAQKAPNARIDVGRTGRDILFWNDRTRKQWATDIYLSQRTATSSIASI